MIGWDLSSPRRCSWDNMNRLNWEIWRRTYTMEIDSDLSEYTPDERRDWDDMWMLNNVVCAIRHQRNVK